MSYHACLKVFSLVAFYLVQVSIAYADREFKTNQDFLTGSVSGDAFVSAAGVTVPSTDSTGQWSVIYDSTERDTYWSSIEWSAIQPELIQVKVYLTDDGLYTGPFIVENGGFLRVPNEMVIKIDVDFLNGNDPSQQPPVLQSLIVHHTSTTSECELESNGLIEPVDFKWLNFLGKPSTGVSDPLDVDNDGEITVQDQLECIDRCVLVDCNAQKDYWRIDDAETTDPLQGVTTIGDWSVIEQYDDLSECVWNSYHYSDSNVPGTQFRWWFAVPEGVYDVYASWSSSPLNTGNANYSVSTVDGVQTITVDQRKHGNRYNLLGRFTLDQNAFVTLENDGFGSITADEILLIKAESETEDPFPNPGDSPTQVGSALGDFIVGLDQQENTLFGLEGNDQIEGGSLADSLFGGDGDDSLFGLNSDDSLYGGDGDDKIVGGTGNDYLSGDAGSDTYYFQPGDGHDVISDYNIADALLLSEAPRFYRQFKSQLPSAETPDCGVAPIACDTLIIGGGLTASDVTWHRDGYNLVITIPSSSETITILNWYSDVAYQLDNIQFEDGTKLAIPVEPETSDPLENVLAAFNFNHNFDDISGNNRHINVSAYKDLDFTFEVVDNDVGLLVNESQDSPKVVPVGYNGGNGFTVSFRTKLTDTESESRTGIAGGDFRFECTPYSEQCGFTFYDDYYFVGEIKTDASVSQMVRWTLIYKDESVFVYKNTDLVGTLPMITPSLGRLNFERMAQKLVVDDAIVYDRPLSAAELHIIDKNIAELSADYSITQHLTAAYSFSHDFGDISGHTRHGHLGEIGGAEILGGEVYLEDGNEAGVQGLDVLGVHHQGITLSARISYENTPQIFLYWGALELVCADTGECGVTINGHPEFMVDEIPSGARWTVVIDSSYIRIFVNNELKLEEAGDFSSYLNNFENHGELRLGRDVILTSTGPIYKVANSGAKWRFDDLALFSKALSNTEVMQITAVLSRLPSKTQIRIYESDLDGDGLLDLYFYGEPETDLHHFSNYWVSGAVLEDALVDVYNGPINYSGLVRKYYNILTGDFDGDGILDMFAQSTTGGKHFILYGDSQNGNNYAQLTHLNGYDITGLTLTVVKDAGVDKIVFYDSEGNQVFIEPEDLKDTALAYKKATTANTPGATPGQFGVNAYGGVNYTVPIEVPPGINGLQPALALTYRNRNTTGALGVGWSLGGMPVISRCPNIKVLGDDQNLGVTYDNTKDKLCLNGKRLKVVSGQYFQSNSKYRTDIDEYSLILFDGNYFTVVQRDGVEIQLDVRQWLSASSDIVLAWYPSAVADRFGNEIAYTYQNGKGIEYPVTNSSGYNFGAGIYPKDIIYGNKKIEFSYVDRAGSSFPRVRYIAGQAQSEPLLLDTITTFIGTEEVGTTQLLYDALLHTRMNILVGVQECRQDSASASGKLCKKETRFDWLYANSQSNDYIETGATYPRKVGGSAVYESVSLDWNGDNVVDLLTVSLDGSMRVLLGAINPAERKLLTIRNPTLAKHPTAITPVDLNSDGKDDLIYLEHEVVENSDPGSSYGSYKKMSSFWRVLISNGSTVPTTNVIEVDSLGDVYLTAEYLQGDMYSKLLHSHKNAAGPFPVVADFTGDGEPELVLPARNGDTDKYFWRAYDVSEPGTELGFVQAFDLNVSFNDYFVAQALDHNGDGIPGIVFESPQNPDLFVSIAPQYWEGKGVGPQSTHLYKSQGTGSSGIDFPEELVQSTLYFDHNGDGLKDILARYIDPADTTGKGQFAVFINTGSQSSGPKFKNAGEVLGNVYEDFNVVKVADIDHDGRDDLILAVGDFPGEKSLKVGLSWPILSSKSNGDLKPIIAIRELLDSVDTLPLPPEVESSLDTIATLTGPDSKGFYFWYSATRALQQLPWLQLADINGDGGIDLLLPKGGTDGQSWQTYYNTMPAPLSIDSIRDGLGNVVDVSYSPLSDSSVHTPSSGAKFPVQDVSGGLYVVDSVKRSNGVGGLNEDTYRYSGAKVHRTGFGFLGFDTVFATKQVGAETETTTETHYSQGTDQYALLGKPTTSVVSDSSGIPLSKQYNDWQEITPVPTVTHVPYLKEQISCRYETDGTLTSAAIESVLDIDSESGIPTHTEVISGYTANCSNVANVTLSSTVYKKVTEVDSTDIINNNSNENWFVGFVGKQKVTESVDHTSKDTKSNVTRFTQYFNNGKPTAKVGQETRFEGSANQEITTTRDFDSFGNLVAETVTPANAAPRSWSWSNFTENQFPAETENPLNQRQTNIVYDQRFGNVALMVDIDGLAESSVFDGFGRLVSTTSKQGTVTEHRYLICDSDCSSANDAVYRVETVQRNNSVQVAPKTVTYLDQFEREILSETEKFKGGLVRVKTEYDAFGRLQRVTQPYSSNSPDYWKEYKAYDVLNRPTLVWLPKSVKYAEQPTIEFDYEARNSGGVTVTKTEKVVNETGSRLLTTQEETDSSGFLVKRTEGYQSPDAVSTEFRYDALGNIRWSRVAGDDNSIVLREYNDANQLISQTDPSSGQKTFANDALGNLLSLIDNGTTTAFTYDKLNRIKTRTDDVGGENFDTEWYYDESSRCVNGKKTGSLCFVEQHGLSIAYAYDNLGRLTDENWLIGKQVGEYQYFSYPIRYQYDNQSRVERLTYPNNEWVSYHYAEQTGDVERIDLNGSMRYQVVSADSLGRVKEVEYGNENHTTYEYDNANGLLLETTTFFDTETLQSFSYAWNSNGNLASRKDNLCTDTSICSSSDQFGYDNLNRLTQYTPTTTLQGLEPDDYSYDVFGNISSVENNAVTYSSTVHNRLESANGIAYQYDPRGNITSRGAVQIDYSSFNKPTRISRGDEFINFRYGPDRARYFKETDDGEKTYYIGGIFEVVENADSSFEKLFVGDFLQVSRKPVNSQSNNQESYLHRDHLGSITLTTREIGIAPTASPIVEPTLKKIYRVKANDSEPTLPENNTVAAAHPWYEPVISIARYSPFGRKFEASDPGYFQNRGYTGHEHLDLEEFIHMNGRVYDPVVGRFLSPDPIIQDPYNSQNYNRYSYVLNNPLSGTDPTGYFGVLYSDYCWGCGSGAENILMNAGNPTEPAAFEGLMNDQQARNVAIAGSLPLAAMALGEMGGYTILDSIATFGWRGMLTAESQAAGLGMLEGLSPAPVGWGVLRSPSSFADNIASSAAARRSSNFSIHNTVDELLQSRLQLGLNSNRMNRRNFAIGEYNINGQTNRLYAISGESSPRGTVSIQGERYFNTRVVGHDRATDTEVKILENIAQRFNPNRLPVVPEINGSLRLASELNVCFSCAGVVRQFQKMFPNISIRVETGPYATKPRF